MHVHSPDSHPVLRLAREHRLISSVLDAFDHYLGFVELSPAEVIRHDLVRFVTFFREAVELSHHQKEETILFPALVRAGMSWDNEPLASLRAEHERERVLTSRLQQVATRDAAWHQREAPQLVEAGRILTEFQRAHISKENALIYRGAQERIVGSAETRLAENLHHFEQREQSAGTQQWLQDLGGELVERYAIDRAG